MYQGEEHQDSEGTKLKVQGLTESHMNHPGVLKIEMKQKGKVYQNDDTETVLIHMDDPAFQQLKQTHLTPASSG